MKEFNALMHVGLISQSPIHLFEIDLETDSQNLENWKQNMRKIIGE